MKKIIAFIMACMMLLSFTACHKNTDHQTLNTEPPQEGSVEIEIFYPSDSLSAVSLAKLMMAETNESDVNQYIFTPYECPNDIIPDVSLGNYDMAILPANLAAVLNQRSETTMYMLCSVTSGNLYLCSKGENISSFDDLLGKTIYTLDRDYGSDYLLRYVLEKNGIDPDMDVTIGYVTKQSELNEMLANEKKIVLVSCQPDLGSIVIEDEIASELDLSLEYSKLNNDSSEAVNEVLIVNGKFHEANPGSVDTFLSDYKESVAFAKINSTEATGYLYEHGIIGDAAVFGFHAPHVLSFLNGTELARIMQVYYSDIHYDDPSNIPNKDFYY